MINPLDDLPFDPNSLIPYDEFNWETVEGMEGIYKSMLKAYQSLVGQMASNLESIESRTSLAEQSLTNTADSMIRGIEQSTDRVDTHLASQAMAMATTLEGEYGNSTLPMSNYIIYRQGTDGRYYPQVEQATSMPIGRESYGPFPDIDVLNQVLQDYAALPPRDSPLSSGQPSIANSLNDEYNATQGWMIARADEERNRLQGSMYGGHSNIYDMVPPNRVADNRVDSGLESGNLSSIIQYNPLPLDTLPRPPNGGNREGLIGSEVDSNTNLPGGASRDGILSLPTGWIEREQAYQPDDSIAQVPITPYSESAIVGTMQGVESEQRTSSQPIIIATPPPATNTEGQLCSADIDRLITAIASCCQAVVMALGELRPQGSVGGALLGGQSGSNAAIASGGDLEYILSNQGEANFTEFLNEEGINYTNLETPTSLGETKELSDSIFRTPVMRELPNEREI